MNRIRTDVFKGLHKRDGSPEGAFLEVSGITTADYPSMKTRPPRSRIGEWENATDVYETDGHLVVIDDNKLYYDGTFLSNVGGTKKQFAEINRKLVIWPDKIYINLNTGELGSLEANVSGSVTMRDGGILTITASSGKGKKEYKNVSGWYYEVNEENNYLVRQEYRSTYFRTYTNLSYSNGWVYDKASTGGISVGSYFIGSAPQTSWNEYETNWPMTGTVYGKVTKVTTVEHIHGGIDPTVPDWEDGGSYDVIVEYELYDAAGIDLAKSFEAGDVVSVSGNALEYNNQEAVKLTGVGKNQLVVDAAFVTKANYYNVTSALAPATYRLVTGTDFSGNPMGTVFQANRTIRAGEQLFVISNRGDSGLEHSGVYAYDTQTKALEAFESVSNTGYTDLQAKNNIYDALTANQLTIERKMPEMDYICERDNRLYGVSNSEEEKIFNTQTGQYETVTSRVLHASALGQPTRWNVFEGAATDSYAVAVAGEGDFTGIVSYSGSVIAFKENRMYKLTGDYPAEFYLRSYTVDGVKEGCHKSLAIINEVLYYLSPYGVMSYSGGVPNLVSYELGIDRYEEAVAGRDRMNYLIQMDKLYCYDTIHGLWVSEDYGKVTGIESVGNSAYIVTDGKIMQTDSGDEKVEWYAMTHFTDEGTFLHKDYQAMNLDAALKDGAELKMEYRTSEEEPWKTLDTMTSYHGTEWQNRKTLNEAKRMHHKFTPGIQRCDRIQFRLSGKGACKIYAYDRVVRFESDKP